MGAVMPWILAASFAVFCLGSFATYCRPVRESPAFLPTFIAASLASGYLWTVGARRCQSTSDLLFFSGRTLVVPI